MLLRDDPEASIGMVAATGTFTVGLAALTGHLYRPLLRDAAPSTATDGPGVVSR